MKGILLVSHGDMAKGMIRSLNMFFGENILQLDYLSLQMDSGADEFGDLIRNKIKELDTGEGVVIFADVLGGTPFNQAALQISDSVDLITGMNLGMLMEYLSNRDDSVYDIDDLIQKGKDGIINIKTLLSHPIENCELDEIE